METRYIFTVTAGRSGRASLTGLPARHVPGCHAAFEEPSPRLHLPGALGDLERHFRRRFVETHEWIDTAPAMNTNAGQGFAATRVDGADIALLERFLARLPAAMRRRLRYFDDYDPARHGAA